MSKSTFLLLIALLIYLSNLNAQERSNTNLTIEAGILPLPTDSENLSFFFKIEPKVKVNDNTFIGLRLGATMNAQSFETDDFSYLIFEEKSDHGVVSFVPTIDYYLKDFYWKEKAISPYFGLGVGYYLLSSVDVFPATVSNLSEGAIEANVNEQVGLLLRGGLESRRLRVGLEYSFIPKADIEIPGGQTVGMVNASYLGLSVGLIIGSGVSSTTN